MKKTKVMSKVNLVDKVIVFVTLFFIFFPWISFGLNNFDTQPWVLITNFLFIIIYSKKNIKTFLFIGHSLLIPIFFIAFLDTGNNSIRGFLSYCIFFSTLHVLYVIFNRFFNLITLALPVFNVVWLAGGLLQFVFGANILNALVVVRSSFSRGLTSFAPEPTHYGFLLLFISWLILIINKGQLTKLHMLLIFLNITFILFVAKSSMVFFYCLLFALYLILSYLSIKQILKFASIALVLFSMLYMFINNNSGNRISNVIVGFFQNPLLIIEVDASINSRLSAVVLSLYGSLQDFFIPHGFNAYIEESERLNRELGGVFWYGYEKSKIMSGTGALLYELGWFGIVIILLSYFIMCGSQGMYKKNILPFLLLWIYLLGAIPISFTLIPAIILAYHFVNKKYSQNVLKY